MKVRVFNVPRTAAAQLVTQQLWPHAPKGRHEVAHFVILGFGPMGQALAVQLALLGHFPNCKRSRFTIADHDIRRTAGAFCKRYRQFTAWSENGLGVESFDVRADEWNYRADRPVNGSDNADCQAIDYVCNVQFVDLSEGCNDILLAQILADRLSAEGVKPMIFVCGQQDRENFDTAVQLREQLASLGVGDAPTFVWLPRQPALAETLIRAGRLSSFGGCRTCASYQETTRPARESIGKAIHEDYEDRAVARGDRTSKVGWESAWDEFRESSRVAADHLLIKLAALGFSLHERKDDARGPVPEYPELREPANLQLLAEMEHYRWAAERLLAGWRFAPPGKTSEETQQNKRRKLNHNLVPWSCLADDGKKDFEQVQTVLQLCQKDGLTVERAPTSQASTR